MSRDPPSLSLALSTTNLDFGDTTNQLTLDVWNAGAGTMNYTLSGWPAWVTNVNATSGTSTNSTDQHTHTVTIDRSKLVLGHRRHSHPHQLPSHQQPPNHPTPRSAPTTWRPLRHDRPQGAVDAGAQWRPRWLTQLAFNWLDPVWPQSRQRPVEFKDVIGWTKPSVITVAIPSGQTTAAIAYYQEVWQPCYTSTTGVNLAGLDFGGSHLPGTYGIDYISPTHCEVDYFASAGMNIIRLPFLGNACKRISHLTSALLSSGACSISSPARPAEVLASSLIRTTMPVTTETLSVAQKSPSAPSAPFGTTSPQSSKETLTSSSV